jgi:ketosteroid isomerase-like protein
MGNMMDVNLPDVASEVRAVFDSYEKALTDNDVAALTRLFWDSPTTLRYGAAENLYGADQIHAFRAARPSGPRPRELLSVRIATFGLDFAVANAEFRNRNERRLGRQSQTWVKIRGQWRIVSAHVSYMDE